MASSLRRLMSYPADGETRRVEGYAAGSAGDVKTNKPHQAKISKGGCCSKVGGVRISKCTKDRDCNVIKAK